MKTLVMYVLKLSSTNGNRGKLILCEAKSTRLLYLTKKVMKPFFCRCFRLAVSWISHNFNLILCDIQFQYMQLSLAIEVDGNRHGVNYISCKI